MIEVLKKNVGPLTWAYCIIAGLLLWSSEGPGLMNLVAIIGVLLGIAGYMSQRQEA